MAKIRHGKKEISVNDGENIADACESLGVPFGCRVGICGSCMIEIVKGSENLSGLTDEEKDKGCDATHRLACQCRITGGTVEIRY